MADIHEMPERDAREAIELEMEEAAEVVRQISHLDGDARNNEISNLRIVEVPVPAESEGAEEAEDAQLAAVESEHLQLVRKFVSHLREVARFYELHPEVKLPHGAQGDLGYGKGFEFTIFGASKPEMVVGVKAMTAAVGRRVEKVFEGDVFQINKLFPSGARLQFWSSREVVCEKIPDGEERVPEKVIPAKLEEIVPATVRPKYRYRCHTLLAPEGADVVEKVEESGESDLIF